MKPSAFLDKLAIALLGGLLLCLGMVLYSLHELEKIEHQIDAHKTSRLVNIDAKLEDMLLRMELKSEERAGTGTVEGGSKESPRDKN